MIQTIFKKDLRLFFADKKGVALTFIMPILLISLFAFAFGGGGKKSNSAKPIEVLVVDEDRSKHSQELILKLDALEGLALISEHKESALEQVLKGKYVAALIFAHGFQDSIQTSGSLPMELHYDAARAIEMGMLQAVLMQELMASLGKDMMRSQMHRYMDSEYAHLDSQIKDKVFRDMDNDAFGFGAAMEDKMELKMTSVIKQDDTRGNLGLIQAVAGTAIMMLLFSIAGMGGGLLEEKEAGTLTRLLYAPLKLTDILFGKMLAGTFISILQLVIMMLFAWLAFGLPIFQDVIALSLMIVFTAFAVGSFGVLLVSMVKTRQQLNGYSTIVIMLMSAIGGSMLPIYIMPEFMQKLAVFTVNYWGIQGFYDIFWRKLPLLEILPKMSVLFGIGVVMISLAIYKFKRNVLQLV